MRGHGSLNTGNPDNKWTHVHALMRSNKLGILAIQEMHLNDDIVEHIQSVHGMHLYIFNSPHPTRPNAAGVAVVINKEILATEHIKPVTLISGRALYVDVPWHKDTSLPIIAAYTPNDPVENVHFWAEIWERLAKRRLRKPVALLTDANIVEDELDCWPSHHDNPDTVEELQNLCTALNIKDGWRLANPRT